MRRYLTKSPACLASIPYYNFYQHKRRQSLEITFTRNVFRLTFAPNQNVFIFPVNAVRLGRHSGFLALPVPVVIATIVSSSIARILQSAIDVF